MVMAPAQSELSAPPRAPRYLTLDHWRGIACLLVVLFHSSGVAFLSMEASGTQPQQAGLAGLALSITRIGWIGVPFFFVISGYAISATADSSRRGRGGPIGYFKRRIRRIYPPLWAMLVLQVAIVFAIDVFLFRGLLTNSIAPIERPVAVRPAAVDRQRDAHRVVALPPAVQRQPARLHHRPGLDAVSTRSSSTSSLALR